MKVVERICKHCGWVGASEDTVGDRVFDPSWRNDPEYQDWGSCPKCHLGTVEAAECRGCGEAYPADDLHEGRCPECYVEWKAGPEVNPVFHSILNALRNGPNVFGGGK
jgi:hypothetical protein